MRTSFRHVKKAVSATILIIFVVITYKIITGQHVSAAQELEMDSDCDKALHFFWKGKLAGNDLGFLYPGKLLDPVFDF